MSVEDLLKTLADSDRDLKAPPAVETRLRSAFQRKYRRRIWPYFAVAAAIAAGIALFFVNTRPKLQTMQIAVVTPPVAVVPVTKPAIRKVAHRRPPPREVMTEFYPLMDAAPPFERGELLRVSLPASAMRTVGLPVSEDRLSDRVQADVLVGEEGLARAIRFIRYER